MKPDAILTRLESSDQGTFGKLECRGKVWFSGELPWRDNRIGRSCIPTGTYEAYMVYVGKFKRNCYLLKNTAPRSSILIHAATFMGDVDLGYRTHLQGCIALGEKLGWIEGQKCVLLSRPAMREFEEILNNEPFVLEVRDGYS